MSVMTSSIREASGRCPGALIDAIRREVRRGAGWGRTAELVADALRRDLPDTSILTADQLRGDPSCYQTHLVHAEADGSFSIAVMVWLPGQQTTIHDHVTWCVTGVIQGAEYEEIFDTSLSVVARNRNEPGTVSGFAPPGGHPPGHQLRNRCGGVDARLRRRHLPPRLQHPQGVHPSRLTGPFCRGDRPGGISRRRSRGRGGRLRLGASSRGLSARKPPRPSPARACGCGAWPRTRRRPRPGCRRR